MKKSESSKKKQYEYNLSNIQCNYVQWRDDAQTTHICAVILGQIVHVWHNFYRKMEDIIKKKKKCKTLFRISKGREGGL